MATKSQPPTTRLPKPSSDPRHRAWRTILEFHSTIISLLDDEMRARTDIDLQTYDVLLHVSEAGDAGIRMTDLADRVLLSKSALTNVVDKLEQRDLAQRVPDATDRRATRIILTPKGTETFVGAAKVHLAGIKRHFSDRIDEREAKVILKALDRIKDEIDPRADDRDS